MSDRIKLALVNEGSAGGIRKHILNIAENLNRNHFEVTVILAKRSGYESEGDPADELEKSGIQYQIIPMVREISPYADFKSWALLRERLSKFNIVHAHSAKAGFLSRFVCHGLRKPCFYSPHVFPFQRTSALKAPFYLALERLAGPWTTAFIVNSATEGEAIIQNNLAGPEKVHVVPNAILPPDLPPENSRQQIRAELGTSEGRIVFTTIGRLVAYKGQQNLIQAFSRIAKQNAELWIVGEGEDADRLGILTKTLGLERQIRLLGYRKDIFSILAASDCFVLASRNEGCPYTVIEALAMQKPIIATAVQGILDLLKGSDHSKLVRWNDIEGLAKALEEFVLRPFPAMPLNRISAELFDLPGQIRRLEEIYLQGKI